MLHQFWLDLGSPSWISFFALLAIVMKVIDDFIRKRPVARTQKKLNEFKQKMTEELLIIHLKIREIESKLSEQSR